MIEIISYQNRYKDYFYKINAEWIERMFIMEDYDEQVLRNPEKYILATGGYIWFAIDKELGVLGTCALLKKGEDFELTKMGVFSKARGKKVGEKLLQHVIAFVKEKQLSCFLLTNKDCQAAIHLYEKNGFKHSEAVMKQYACTYERCNVAMRLS